MRLVSLTAQSPHAAELRRRLAVLGEDIMVQPRDVPGLQAMLDTPAGRVVLR